MTQPIHVTIRQVGHNTIDLSLCPLQYRMSDRARDYILTQCKLKLVPYIGTPLVLINRHGHLDLSVPSHVIDDHLQQAQIDGWLQYKAHTGTWGVYL